ncbi:MAG TPA: Rieske 2Fe-2S domain-containing protein [Thermoleophilaceae bacterium]|nr:Rieske 2Fe-2S domain-containing protein [Thermoleophilaceae bacterium]
MADTRQRTAGRPTRPALHALAERVGRLEALDGPAEAYAKKVRGLFDPGPVKDALSGAWLGHALHPLLTDIPIGTWTSATMLDFVGGRRAHGAAERLIGIGLVAAVPTSITGSNDWADTTPASDSVRRIGAVHAVANTAALLLYASSLRARRHGRRGRGVALGAIGLGALTVGGHLGGHLSYDKGVGVQQTAFREFPDEWTPTVGEEEVREGEATHASAGDVDVVLSRYEGRIYALADRCTHRSGSLAQGTVVDGCVTCPLHGSIFSLLDGSVVRGPAGAPEPAFDVRIENGTVEVRVRA